MVLGITRLEFDQLLARRLSDLRIGNRVLVSLFVNPDEFLDRPVPVQYGIFGVAREK